MNKLLVLLCFVSSCSIASQYDAIPSNVAIEDLNVTFNLPDSIDGAMDMQVVFSVIPNTYDEVIFKHYSKYLSAEWELCSAQFDEQVSDNAGLSFLWFNKHRKLSASLDVHPEVSGRVSKVYFVQYIYRNEEQFNMEYKICNSMQKRLIG